MLGIIAFGSLLTASNNIEPYPESHHPALLYSAATCALSYNGPIMRPQPFVITVFFRSHELVSKKLGNFTSQKVDVGGKRPLLFFSIVVKSRACPNLLLRIVKRPPLHPSPVVSGVERGESVS
jgi:hypothetical protein